MKSTRCLAVARRSLVALLSLALVIGLVPTTALAEMVRLEDEAVRELVEPLAMDEDGDDRSTDELVLALGDVADQLAGEAGEGIGDADVVRAAFGRLVRAQALARLEELHASATATAEGAAAVEAAEPDLDAAKAPVKVTSAEVRDALLGRPVTDEALVRSFALLVRVLGTEAVEVSWPADEMHGQAWTWVLVQVEGSWYHVDVVATVHEVVSELGSIEFARTVEDAQWEARLGENCEWLLASDQEVKAESEDRGPLMVAEGELERLGLDELPACPEAYEWAGEPTATEGAVEPEEVMAEAGEAEGKADGTDEELVDEAVAGDDGLGEAEDTQADGGLEGGVADQLTEAAGQLVDADGQQMTGADDRQTDEPEGQQVADEGASGMAGEVPTKEDGAPDDGAPGDGNVLGRTVESVSSVQLMTPTPEEVLDQEAAPEQGDGEDATPEPDDGTQADADVQAGATADAKSGDGARSKEAADAEATVEAAVGEDAAGEVAKPNPEDLEVVDLELHLYQNGWIPTQEEQEGLELEAMASTLTSTQRQALKARIVRGCEDLVTYIDVSDLNISTDVSTSTISDVLSEAINENPDLFYVYGSGSSWSGGIYYYIYPYYWEGFDNASTASQMRANYELQLKDMLAWVPLTSSNYDKCKAVHDWLVKVCVYTQDVADGKDWVGTHSGTEKYRPFTAYGALVVHDAVCNGYALAYRAAMNRLGIPCVVVTSGAIDHAWNLVQINGNWYHVDCTWDDPVGNSGYWGKTTLTKWFMKSDSYMLSTYNNSGIRHHSWTPTTHSCSDKTYDSWPDGWWAQWNGTWSRTTPTGYSIPTSVSMTTDAQRKLAISNLTPSNAPLTDANWTSSNSVVSVSSAGVVSSGKGAGIATVTCSIWGVKRTTKVYVYGGSLSGSGITVALSPTSYDYNGNAKKPSVKVTHKTSTGTLTLREGIDYSVSYSNNVGPGTATVTIKGLGSYTGSAKKAFVIYGNIATASVSGLSNKTYRGKAITQSVTVKVAGKTLKKGTDYTVSYKNNNKVGTATMIITGKGAYKGTRKVTFKIVQNVPKWQRYGGSTALDTARLVVEADSAFKAGRGDMVIVATSNGYWDALAASALAGVFDAPVLITNGSRLSSQTKAEIQRLKATRVIIVGGTAAVSDGVAHELYNMTGSVYRVAGANAVETATSIFSTWNEFGYWGSTAIVATSNGYWDALAIAPYAFKAKAPIFLTGSGNKLTTATVSAIRSGGFSRVVIVGGKAAVSGSVESQLKSANVKTVVRLSGATALDTSAEIAKWEIKQGMGVSHLTLATSNGYWDALTGAAVCGKLNSVLVLVSKGGDVRAFKAVYDKNKVTHGHILGGTAAVPASVERYVKSQ